MADTPLRDGFTRRPRGGSPAWQHGPASALLVAAFFGDVAPPPAIVGGLTRTQASSRTASGRAQLVGATARSLAQSRLATGRAVLRGGTSQTLTLDRSAAGTTALRGGVARALAVAATRDGTVPVQGGVARTQRRDGVRAGAARVVGARTHALDTLATRRGRPVLAGARGALLALDRQARATTTLRGGVQRVQDLVTEARGRVLVLGRATRTLTLLRALRATSASEPLQFVVLRNVVAEPEARVLRLEAVARLVREPVPPLVCDIVPDPRLQRDPRDAPLLRLEVAA